MEIIRHSLFSLSQVGNELYAQGPTPFSQKQYSRLKYGAIAEAQFFGKLLAESFLEKFSPHKDAFFLPEWHLTSSAFKCIPTAAYSVTQYFKEAIREKGFPKPEHCKIIRNTLYDGEYEKLDLHSRLLVMKNCKLALSHYDLKNKTLVVVDDIRVTGAHERRVLDLVTHTQPARIVFAYLAIVEETNLDPVLEHILNGAEVDSIDALVELILTEDVFMNARLCKRLLLWPKPNELEAVLLQLPKHFLIDLAESVKAEGYLTCPKLAPAVFILQKVIQKVLQQEPTHITGSIAIRY